MSTDETQPMRPQPPRPPERSSQNPPPDTRRPPQAPYQRSVEPQTTRIDPPAQPSFQPSYSPPSSPPPSPGSSPPPPSSTGEPGWPEQPPKYRAPDSPGSPAYGGASGNAGAYRSPGYDSPRYGSPPPADTYGLDSQPGGKPRRRGRRRRRWTMAIFAIIVVLILLVVGDRVAKAVAENDIANQIKQGDSQINPSVNIPGFPFLTQIIARDIHEIDISANNVPAGPVTITSVHAVAKGVHINGSFNGGKVDSINATVFVGYSSLSSALSSESSGIANLTLTSAGNGQIKANLQVAGASLVTATGTITLKGNTVNVTWSNSSGGSNSGLGGLIGGLAGGNGGTTLPPLSFTIPKLPAGVQITGFQVGAQGITIMGAAHNTTLSQ